MDFKKITIIGVGLMGGSFALAMRRQGFKGRITGVGRRRENLIKAKENGIIDEYSTVAADGIENAELILLSTPVGQFERVINDIKDRIKKGAVVTDVGSVKGEVVKRLEPLMPEGVSFVGAHPIAGGESSGIETASAELFRDARCIITPGSKTDKKAVEVIANLWEVIGSRVTIMSPEEHDFVYATVSHLPHVIAYTLINTILNIREDFLPYGGRGLKDMTRIALSPVELWRDICIYNRDNILNVMRNFSSSLSRMIEIMERSDWVALEKEFEKASKGRRLLESN